MLFTAGLFVTIGVLVKNAKWYFLIAGYNSMSKEKKERFNINRIATIIHNGLFGMALLIFIGLLLSEFINSEIKVYTYYLSLIIGIPYILILSSIKK